MSQNKNIARRFDSLFLNTDFAAVARKSLWREHPLVEIAVCDRRLSPASNGSDLVCEARHRRPQIAISWAKRGRARTRSGVSH